MKTLDGAALIAKRLEKLLSQYPADSISKRDVLLTIPMDYDEEKIQRLNAALTQTIYKQAEEFVKSRPEKPQGGRFSQIAKDISYADTRAEQEAFNNQLTQSVLDVASTIFKTPS